MLVQSNRIRILICGVIGVSAVVIYIYRRNKILKAISRDEIDKGFTPELNTNFNHFSHEKPKLYKSIATGRSDVTGSISSRRETHKESMNEDSIDELSCGRMGLKSLDDVISNLHQSITKLEKYDAGHVIHDSQSDSRQLFNEMKDLLEKAFQIRQKYKQKLIITSDSYVGSDDSDDDSDSDESFVSAKDYYQDDDMIGEYLEATTKERKYLLRDALQELEAGNICYR